MRILSIGECSESKAGNQAISAETKAKAKGDILSGLPEKKPQQPFSCWGFHFINRFLYGSKDCWPYRLSAQRAIHPLAIFSPLAPSPVDAFTLPDSQLQMLGSVCQAPNFRQPPQPLSLPHWP